MKTINLISILVFITNLSFSQTIVNTSVEKMNVILEEFTGIHCSNCPDGHRKAQAIKDAHPDDVFLINLHTTKYAIPKGPDEPDFRTDFNSKIQLQTRSSAIPKGTVNRTLFSGSLKTSLGRDDWAPNADIILNQNSIVNVGVESEINLSTRELTVHVELYYTGTNSDTANLLNIALLQNNTLGYQSNGGMGDNYVHQHRLVDLITGQWGESFSVNGVGTFINKTYTYSVPDDYRGVIAKLDDLEVVAFVTRNNGHYILSGNGCKPSIASGSTGIEDFENQSRFLVYPNPVTNVLTIENANNANIKLFNVLGGKMLMQVDEAQQIQQVDISKLKNGSYFVQITKGNYTEVKKIIKSK